MPISLPKLVAARPYLFHLTARENVPRIARTGTLEPAATLLEKAGRHDRIREKRPDHLQVAVSDCAISLRDQRPLHAGNMSLSDGWSFEDLIESLNMRVFFWPGTLKGPSDYGRRHFARYEGESPAVIRVPTASLLAANPHVEPTFCRFNSGSPRWTGGRPSPRGPDTFVTADRFSGGVGDVVEVTFEAETHVPPDAEVGYDPDGPWHRLGVHHGGADRPSGVGV